MNSYNLKECSSKADGTADDNTRLVTGEIKGGLPERKSFSIISKLLLEGPRVASCFVAFLNLIGRGVTPMEGSVGVALMNS